MASGDRFDVRPRFTPRSASLTPHSFAPVCDYDTRVNGGSADVVTRTRPLGINVTQSDAGVGTRARAGASPPTSTLRIGGRRHRAAWRQRAAATGHLTELSRRALPPSPPRSIRWPRPIFASALARLPAPRPSGAWLRQRMRRRTHCARGVATTARSVGMGVGDVRRDHDSWPARDGVRRAILPNSAQSFGRRASTVADTRRSRGHRFSASRCESLVDGQLARPCHQRFAYAARERPVESGGANNVYGLPLERRRRRRDAHRRRCARRRGGQRRPHSARVIRAAPSSVATAAATSTGS